jgi:chromate reductase, NAD(P)H dehydrogenase (quinone)
MQLLAISGSLRAGSTNTALLHVLAKLAAPRADVKVFTGLGDLPIFNPDAEGAATPVPVLAFADAVRRADGLIISCPEYVHALPGGFKNAIDWLVSRDEISGKPIALLHASHGGEDVLSDLRRVLATVSDRFASDIFARFSLRKLSPEAIADRLAEPEEQAKLTGFLDAFKTYIRAPDQASTEAG